MKAKTWCVIGAILFAAVVQNEVVSVILLGCGVVPVIWKLLQWSYALDHPEERQD